MFRRRYRKSDAHLFFNGRYKNYIRITEKRLGVPQIRVQYILSLWATGRKEDAINHAKGKFHNIKRLNYKSFPGFYGSGLVTEDTLNYLIHGEFTAGEYHDQYYALFPLLERERDYYISIIDEYR